MKSEGLRGSRCYRGHRTPEWNADRIGATDSVSLILSAAPATPGVDDWQGNNIEFLVHYGTSDNVVGIRLRSRRTRRVIRGMVRSDGLRAAMD